MNEFDKKINTHFQGLVVRKDLVKTVKGNAIVPSYVLEYLLGQYCATSDEATIQTGIETVKEILRKHYVHRNEAGLIKSVIREKGRHKVIDKIGVQLNDKDDVYEASFSNLGVSKILVDTDTVKQHPKLLTGGVWCICDVEYESSEDKRISPWLLQSLKPIQLSHFDYDGYLEARKQFSTDEWIDLLLQSIGFNPEMFGPRSKLLQLARLIPFCERNYNIIELGPKGTGKSHIYSEFSPHGILISGGEVTVPKLFVNNSNGKLGLVGYWDTVAFDEFAGKEKRPNKALVDIMKNYMANKTFSRGVETLGAEASMVFVGNTKHNVPYMLRHSDLFEELPAAYYDSAFLDRLHFYIPGWEVDIIRGEMFSDGYGFVVDYLAEILKTLRNHDLSQDYKEHFELFNDISTRDRDAIQKTFSGLMKILFPHGEVSKEEVEILLQFSIEGRKRVKDQLMRIDSTYRDVQFGYEAVGQGRKERVKTLEERQYPQHYYQGARDDADGSGVEQKEPLSAPPEPGLDLGTELKEQHLVIEENQKGISFDDLFGPYLNGATDIVVTDAYIRKFHQARNLMEFLETVVSNKSDDEEVLVKLITIEDEFCSEQQKEYLMKIQENVWSAGINFSWEFDEGRTIHARHIVTNSGWKILLDRGLDIFQHFDGKDAFSLASKLQRYRLCKKFEVTIVPLK
ncbi:BREX system Lon protease-like protein BrxL [Desulfogranum mediterraneum]|uniref:BREX system Lon protease-like protein BrxL n=1 Tax=Desulfogranum mediterraneum TaxID=160661 RepID=UPI000424F69D|nr:BREX system Lon protease-like protein BrxL [Desulfogranum mediterraneum]